MARKKNPKGLRALIGAEMVPDKGFTQDSEFFDGGKWRLLPPKTRYSRAEVMKAVENNFEKLDYRKLGNLKHTGWHLWNPNDDSNAYYMVWLHINATPDDSEYVDDTMETDIININNPAEDPTLDNLIVNSVSQDDTWGHMDRFEYALIIPTDDDMRYEHIFNQALLLQPLNWKLFPKVLLEDV